MKPSLSNVGSVSRRAALLLILLLCTAWLSFGRNTRVTATELPGTNNPVYLQTNAPATDMARGDWYSASTSGNTTGIGAGGYHYFQINIPSGWPANTPVNVDLFSPEMNTTHITLSDESDNTPAGGGTTNMANTTFELYAPGTAFVGPNQPGPGASGSLIQTSYPPSTSPEQWVRFYTIANPTAGTSYLLRAQSRDDDQNGWRLRVGTDNDADPNNAPPANYDNPNGVPGGNDEITIGILQASYQHDTGTTTCLNLYQQVGVGQASVAFHNFDMDGGSGTVKYYSPSGSVTNGTVSGNAVWNNGGVNNTRGSGDVITTPQAGWWRIETCVSNHNQFIQEGMTSVPSYYGAVLGDKVFVDTNNNGIQDSGEPGLPRATVQLFTPGADGIAGNADDVLVKTTTTNANGTYSFNDIGAGNYYVKFAAPAGYHGSPQASGSDRAVDSDPDPATGRTPIYAIAPGVTVLTVDAGFYLPATIGDQLFLDQNRDGVQSVGEPGIPNVTVLLYTAGPDGIPGNADDVLVKTSTTTSNGTYSFSGVAPGNYYVKIDTTSLPAGLAINPASSNPSPLLTVTSGQVYLKADFPFVNASSSSAIIGDAVWSDVNGNGLLDPGEPGIGGVTLALKGPGTDGILGTADDTSIANATTAADGSYHFSAVSPGTYLVNVTDTGSKLTGYTLSIGAQSNTNPSAPISVAGGDVYVNADFGYRKATGQFSIADTVFYDSNGNGTQDGGEPGIAGVTVSLVDGSAKIVATTITGSAGSFAFGGLANGSYTVKITDGAAVLANEQGTTVAATAGQRAVTISGANITGTNFGYSLSGSIGDTIFSDNNSNATQDAGEAGIGGITVKVTSTRMPMECLIQPSIHWWRVP